MSLLLLFNQAVAVAATAFTMTGPASGAVGIPSGAFTFALSPGGSTSPAVVITPACTLAGAFTPTTVTLSTAAPTATATFTASAAGAGTVSATNSGTLTNPAALAFTSNAATSLVIVTIGPGGIA